MVMFFNYTATTEIYTLSLHDALPISEDHLDGRVVRALRSRDLVAEKSGWVSLTDTGRAEFEKVRRRRVASPHVAEGSRSEEHTSELQSRQYLVCRLLLEKKHHNQAHA